MDLDQDTSQYPMLVSYSCDEMLMVAEAERLIKQELDNYDDNEDENSEVRFEYEVHDVEQFITTVK